MRVLDRSLRPLQVQVNVHDVFDEFELGSEGFCAAVFLGPMFYFLGRADICFAAHISKALMGSAEMGIEVGNACKALRAAFPRTRDVFAFFKWLSMGIVDMLIEVITTPELLGAERTVEMVLAMVVLELGGIPEGQLAVGAPVLAVTMFLLLVASPGIMVGKFSTAARNLTGVG